MKFIFLIYTILLMSGCGKEFQNREIFKSPLICTEPLHNPLAVNLNFLSKSPLETNLGPEARIFLNLYGINTNIADVSATKIDSQTFYIEKTPFQYKITFPENAHTLIKNPVVKTADEAKYYYTFYIDINGDDKICKGDYRQDYDNSSIDFFETKPPKEITFNIFEIEDDRCYQI